MGLVVAFLVQGSRGYFITVEPHSEECFFDKVKKDAKMGLTFEVAEGGFLDIDVKIYGPDNKPIHAGDRESNGKFTFAAPMDGTYRYCFGNQMSTMTPKIVMFNMEIGEAPADGEGEEGDQTKLESMIKELGQTIAGVKHEQEYMQVRDRIHRTVNDNTNSRVVLWSMFEAVFLLALSAGQVYYLKRFFEVKRVV